MADAQTLPMIPQYVEVWNGPRAEKALADAGLPRAVLSAAIGRTYESMRRYFLAPEDPKHIAPPQWMQSVFAQWARVRLEDLQVRVELIRTKDGVRVRSVPQLSM